MFVVFSVGIHCPGSGKAKEGKCQKLKPSFEEHVLVEVRFADSAPRVWLLERQLGSSSVCFFSAVSQFAAAAAAHIEGQEPFRVFFRYNWIVAGVPETLPVMLGFSASSCCAGSKVCVCWSLRAADCSSYKRGQGSCAQVCSNTFRRRGCVVFECWLVDVFAAWACSRTSEFGRAAPHISEHADGASG